MQDLCQRGTAGPRSFAIQLLQKTAAALILSPDDVKVKGVRTEDIPN